MKVNMYAENEDAAVMSFNSYQVWQTDVPETITPLNVAFGNDMHSWVLMDNMV